jgi:hypothetical protein
MNVVDITHRRGHAIPVWVDFSTEQEHTFPIDHNRVFIPRNLEKSDDASEASFT